MRNDFRTQPRLDTLIQKKKISRHARNLIRNFNKNMQTISAKIIRKDIVPLVDNTGWKATFWITFSDKFSESIKTMVLDYQDLVKEFNAD